MSALQLRWVRTYRQAIEKIVQRNEDRIYSDGPFEGARTIAFAKLTFIVDLWQVSDVSELLADCAEFRKEFPNYPGSFEK